MATKTKIAYNAKEKMLLAELVGQYSSTIENKKTCGTTWAQKQVAWEVICAQYNSQPEVQNHRTCEQLKKLWANLKQLRRKEITAQKQDMFKTGGGELKQVTTEKELLEKVDVVAPHLYFEIDAGNWDSNSSPLENSFDLIKMNAEAIQQSDATQQSDAIQQSDATQQSDAITQQNTRKTLVKPHSNVSKSGYNPKARYIDKERQLRVTKLQDAIEQQAELHRIKLEMAHMEAECIKIRLEREKLLLQKEKSYLL